MQIPIAFLHKHTTEVSYENAFRSLSNADHQQERPTSSNSYLF